MNKASGGDGIPVEQFQILKDDAVKMLHSICKFGKLWKYDCSSFPVQFLTPPSVIGMEAIYLLLALR